jgi:hypothetical protein
MDNRYWRCMLDVIVQIRDRGLYRDFKYFYLKIISCECYAMRQTCTHCCKRECETWQRMIERFQSKDESIGLQSQRGEEDGKRYFWRVISR